MGRFVDSFLLNFSGLTDLKTRRERGDFIQNYNIVHGLEKVNWCDENIILRPEQNETGQRFSSLVSVHQESEVHH